MKNSLIAVAILGTIYSLTGCKPKDRLDDIVRDLSADSFSLSFDKTYPDHGISKTSYGAESFIVRADPEDAICGEPWRIRFPKHPVIVWGNPNRVIPTCPKFVPENIADLIKNIITDADRNYSDIVRIRTFDRNTVLFGNGQFKNQYASLKPDVIDDSVLHGLDYSKFLLLHAVDQSTPGFTRDFYGHADIGGIRTAATGETKATANTNFIRIFKPQLIGCLDPEILRLIKERFAAFNSAAFQSWQLSRLPQDSSVAILSQQ